MDDKLLGIVMERWKPPEERADFNQIWEELSDNGAAHKVIAECYERVLKVPEAKRVEKLRNELQHVYSKASGIWRVELGRACKFASQSSPSLLRDFQREFGLGEDEVQQDPPEQYRYRYPVPGDDFDDEYQEDMLNRLLSLRRQKPSLFEALVERARRG